MVDATSLVAVWAFGSAWMLLWGLAAAIPIVIHLWNRRQQEEVAWAAMPFLLAAVRKHSRRIRFEQWLLLALRCLVLILLALALADPLLSTLSSTTAAPATGGPKHTVLVVDGSYSMDARSGGSTNFERAQQLAAQLLAEAAQGDGFTLVLMADPPEAVISETVFEADNVIQELERLELRHTGADLPATLEVVEDLVERAGRRHPRLVEHQVCFFTDLGANTWQAALEDASRRQVAELAEKASLALQEVGSVQGVNLAIQEISTSHMLPTVGSLSSFEIEVKNFGSRPQRSELEMLVGGRRVFQEEMEVPSGGSVTRSVSHRFERAGHHAVEARLGEDTVSVDNRRWFSISIREAVQVLCIQGKQGAAEFVAMALDPQEQARGPIGVEVAGEHALLERDLSEYDCLFLCNVGRWGSKEAEILGDYVRQGGGLITILGDQVQAESYNEALAGEDSAQRVLPARLGELVGEQTHHFDPSGYEHPIIEPFRGHERSGLLTAPVWRYIELTPISQAASTALSFDSGDVALITEAIGKGRSVLLATAASFASVDRTSDPPTPWTALPSWPSFPPLVHEMLRFAVGGKTDSHNLRVGDRLASRTASEQNASTIFLTTPDETTRRLPLAYESGRPSWSYEETYFSGIYRAAPEASDQAATELFAVNVDTRESDLARLDVELLPSQFTDFQPEAGGEAADTAQKPLFPWFRLLLAGVVLLLVGESALACWIGRRTA